MVWHEERSRALLAALRCRAAGPAQGQVRALLAGTEHSPKAS